MLNTGLRRLCVAYSSISLGDVAKKLHLDTPDDAEAVVSKVHKSCPLRTLAGSCQDSLLSAALRRPLVHSRPSRRPSATGSCRRASTMRTVSWSALRVPTPTRLSSRMLPSTSVLPSVSRHVPSFSRPACYPPSPLPLPLQFRRATVAWRHTRAVLSACIFRPVRLCVRATAAATPPSPPLPTALPGAVAALPDGTRQRGGG